MHGFVMMNLKVCVRITYVAIYTSRIGRYHGIPLNRSKVSIIDEYATMCARIAKGVKYM